MNIEGRNALSNSSYNTLIAGVVGSGKSTIINGIIKYMIGLPEKAYMVLIDPKHTELLCWKNHPNALWYADEPDAIADTLLRVGDLMDLRFQRMKNKGLKVSDEPDVFVFVDEMTFLMQSKQKKIYTELFTNICLLGRAARIHLILCSQVSTQAVIPACIRDNMVNLVVLKQRDEQKYRYLLGKMPAGGPLPMYGFAYVLTPWMNRPAKVKSEDVWKTITDTSTMDFMNGKTGLEIA